MDLHTRKVIELHHVIRQKAFVSHQAGICQTMSPGEYVNVVAQFAS